MKDVLAWWIADWPSILPFLQPHTTVEDKQLAHFQRSWKVRWLQCIYVMTGLERRISPIVCNDYGNNMIISLLSLSFLSCGKSRLL